MTKTRGTGLLMVWTDIDPEYEDAFNAWYNEEHIPHLAKVPGILNSGRYRAVRGGPKYLAMYELEDHNVLRGTDFANSTRYKPTARRTGSSGGHIGRNFILNTYRQIFPARTDPIECQDPEMPKFLQIGRIDIPGAMEEEFNDWYNTNYIPAFLQVPGVIRSRRYLAVESQPKYMTVYEFENAKVSDTPEWGVARDSNPWNLRVRPHLRLDAGSPAVFQRIFPEL